MATSTEIEELKKQLLLIAQTISAFICESTYNMFIPHLAGEEREQYVKHWKEKENTTMEKVVEVRTVEEALDIATNFYQELFDYIKAQKVATADKAMDIAHSFIKKYAPVALPLKAMREKDVWVVDIDVGALAVKIAKVKVDARTGDILSYDIPRKESKES